MKKVLVIATTFPRWKNESTPGFVFHLSRLLTKKYDVFAEVPHTYKAKKSEIIDKVKVHRFRYFLPEKLQKLCYNGGILPNIRKSALAKMQVPFLLFSEFFSILRTIKKEKINFVHAHWILPQGFLAAIIKKMYNVPFIVTVHAGDIFPLKNPLLKKIAKFTLKNCSICTVNSVATKIATQKLTKKIPEIKIIPMGVDLKLFNPKKNDSNLKKQLGIGGKVVLVVGRLAEKKGLKYLIQAFPQVLKKFPKAKLIIIGEGPEKDNLKQITKNLKLNNNIFFLGEIKNQYLPRYYSIADVFVLPSIIAKNGDTEGLGVVLLEAIATGTPVIGSNVGGIPDIIVNNKMGLLVEQKNTIQLSKSIIKILSDNKLRKEFIKTANNHVKEKYSWEKVSKNFLEIYDELEL